MYAGAISASLSITFSQSIDKTFDNTDPQDYSNTKSLNSNVGVYFGTNVAQDIVVDFSGSISYDMGTASAVFGINDRALTDYTDLTYDGYGRNHPINSMFCESETQTLTSSVITSFYFIRNTGVLQCYGSNSYSTTVEGNTANSVSVSGLIGFNVGEHTSRTLTNTTGILGQTGNTSYYSSAKPWSDRFMDDAVPITQQQFENNQYTITRDTYDNNNVATSDGIIRLNTQSYYYLFDGLTLSQYLDIISLARDSGTTVVCEYEN